MPPIVPKGLLICEYQKGREQNEWLLTKFADQGEDDEKFACLSQHLAFAIPTSIELTPSLPPSALQFYAEGEYALEVTSSQVPVRVVGKPALFQGWSRVPEFVGWQLPFEATAGGDARKPSRPAGTEM